VDDNGTMKREAVSTLANERRYERREKELEN